MLTSALPKLGHFLVPAALYIAALTTACTTMPSAPSEVVQQLAPGQVLRAAINLGNPILASKDPDNGDLRGVSVDLAHALADRLGVRLQLMSFQSAGSVVDAGARNGWDVAFVAIDPVRGKDLLQTQAYVTIEGAYMVKTDSPITSNDEVDRPGIKVAVARGSAYDLYLTRELKQAEILRADTSPAVTDFFLAQRLDVAAGVKQQMQADAARQGGLRLLPGRFMRIDQAMATPKGHDLGATYLQGFVGDMKDSGFVARSLKVNHIEGAEVAP